LKYTLNRIEFPLNQVGDKDEYFWKN